MRASDCIVPYNSDNAEFVCGNEMGKVYALLKGKQFPRFFAHWHNIDANTHIMPYKQIQELRLCSWCTECVASTQLVLVTRTPHASDL
jgi:hypothetical protein